MGETNEGYRPTKGRVAVTEAELELLRERVRALPPMTDEQIDGLCEVIVNFKRRQMNGLEK